MTAQAWTYELHAAIAHGDDEHKAWLLDAIIAWSENQPIPPPRGKGNKEAEIERLRAELDYFRKPCGVDAPDNSEGTHTCVHCGGYTAVRSTNSICSACAREETGD